MSVIRTTRPFVDNAQGGATLDTKTWDLIGDITSNSNVGDYEPTLLTLTKTGDLFTFVYGADFDTTAAATSNIVEAHMPC